MAKEPFLLLAPATSGPFEPVISNLFYYKYNPNDEKTSIVADSIANYEIKLSSRNKEKNTITLSIIDKTTNKCTIRLLRLNPIPNDPHNQLKIDLGNMVILASTCTLENNLTSDQLDNAAVNEFQKLFKDDLSGDILKLLSSDQPNNE